MKQVYLFVILCFWCITTSYAQYISRSEPLPYACPTVCAGGLLTLRVNQIENLPNGSAVQAWLSNANASFATGTNTLEASQYSTNNGTTWLNGPYVFTGNINNLLIRIELPAALPPGNQYTIRMRASTGYVSNDLFQCGGSNFITVSPFIEPLPQVAQNTFGINQWIAHAYSWNATTGAELNTPALIAQQDFFNPGNYLGHMVYNPLAFDLNLTTNGFIPGTLHSGTSMNCGTVYTTNFSLRLQRTHNFAPGFYQFTLQGDDGIRLSLDGGITWIIGSFIEQNYAVSFRSTATSFPNGICLSGETDLVVEFFQRPADARLTLGVTLLSSPFDAPQNSSICAGQNTSFNAGNASPGLTWQWEVSTDNGLTFSPISNNALYSGATNPTLNITNATASMDGYLYRCNVGGACPQAVSTPSAVLNVQGNPSISQQPSNQTFCEGEAISFSVESPQTSTTFQWQFSTDGGVTFTNVPSTAPYSGVTSNQLLINPATETMIGYQYRCILNGCSTPITSSAAEIISGGAINITVQPMNQDACAGETIVFSIESNGNSTFEWLVNSGSGFVPLTNGPQVNGAATNTLTLSNVSVNQNGNIYVCIAGGGCSNEVVSSPALLTVGPEVNILQQPANQSICDGESTSFSINVSGSNISHQWQLSSDNGISFTDILPTAPYSGVNTPNLTLDPVGLNLSGFLFRCVYEGDCGGVRESETALLTVSSLPSFNTQPSDLEACTGSSITLNASAGGTVNYQWQISLDGGASFSNLTDGQGITGATTATLVQNSVPSQWNNALLQVEIEGCGAVIISNQSTITLIEGPQINSQTQPEPTCAGETVVFEVEASNVLDYQWQINTGNGFTDIENGPGINGANTSTLEILDVPLSYQLVSFRCIVSGNCTPDTGQSMLLSLKGVPLLLNVPAPPLICSGGGWYELPVSALGEGISYQWQILNEDGVYEDIVNNPYFRNSETSILGFDANVEINGSTVRGVLDGCGEEISTPGILITILENDPVYIPSAFSPDGDNLNDRFFVYTSENTNISARIFNRWGEELYQWSNVSDAWDGTYLGEAVQEGVYVYRISYSTACESKTIMGTVSLFR